jgi:[protein-PII] uridylyltransferase
MDKSVFIRSLKEKYQSRQNAIKHKHREDADGFMVCEMLTSLTDTVIKDVYDFCDHPGKNELAILALGGYGRSELCPKSDIDVMYMRREGENGKQTEEGVESLLHLLWDLGFEVGHSFRSIQECLDIHSIDIDSWAALLESRFICGNEAIHLEFHTRLSKFVEESKNLLFVRMVLDEMDIRHSKYGNSVKLLEPNIKKSAGGLRDLHSLVWILRSIDSSFLPSIPSRKAAVVHSACQQTLTQICQRGIIDSTQHRQVTAALNFLLRTRNEIHFTVHFPDDTLAYSIQEEIAEGLGYQPSNGVREVEQFMRDYYLHARKIFRLNQTLGAKFWDLVKPSTFGYIGKTALDDTYILHEGWLSLSSDQKRYKLSSPVEMFKAFDYKCKFGAHFSEDVRDAISHNLNIVNETVWTSTEISRIFREIVSSPDNVSMTLRSMNELGVLGRYIPEFGKLIAFFQHSMYHYYTADEHTLIAIENLEKLHHQQTHLGDVFRSIQRKDVLYLAMLLHDIGKPVGVDKHEITGAEIAQEILHRIGFVDGCEDVSFLIRHHLSMEQIAFRRNIDDMLTIKESAKIFRDQAQLDMLYVMTYADLSAANPSVWTEWKGMLLRELHERTSLALAGQIQEEELFEIHRERTRRAIEDAVHRLSELIGRDVAEQHLLGIDSEGYLAAFDDKEIAEHVAKIEGKDTIATIFKDSGGYTEVTVIGHDAPGAMSKFCGVLSANDANIFDAKIFTRKDGIIIDYFKVFDFSSQKSLNEEQRGKIHQELNEVFDKKIGLHDLFEKHRRRWRRRTKLALNSNIRIDVEFEDTEKYTIVDVYAPDTLGFLYRVTETISRFGLDIQFAKIATRMDGIVDAFYVRDSNGKPLTDEAKRKEIRERILSVITELNELELSVET